MAENPSDYDKLQDGRLDSLESLITAEYEPPAGAQYSYPVASQGITQDQWQQMNLHTGDGVIISDGSEFPFALTSHDTDSETNQRDTLILRVSRNTGKNEAALAGFYFRQTEDIELPFPPVTTTTVCHVTVTYDPRKFKTEPLRVEVWAGEPPRAQGQKHILLKTVERRPNQLLSQATISTYRHHVAPTIVAREKDTLPNATDVLYGTLGVTRSRTAGSTVIPGTGGIYEARGIHGWHNLLVGPWEPCTDMRSSWRGNASARNSFGSIDLYASIEPQDGSPGTLSAPDMELFRLPASMRPERLTRFQATPTGPSGMRDFYVDTEGWVRNSFTENSRYDWIRFNISIPSA